MKKFLATLSGFAAVAVLAVVPLASAVVPANTVVVTGDTAAGENYNGWMFDRDPGSSTAYEFTSDEASTGEGSIYVPPIGANGSDKFIAEYFYLDEIANIENISFDFKTVNPADVQDFYMNLYVNDGADPTEFYDCRYNIVPTVFTPGSNGFMTVSYDLSTPTSVTQRGSSSIIPCPSNPTELEEDAILRAIAINVGQSNNSDTGTEGYVDNVVISEVGDVTTTYDFEPVMAPSTKDDCKNGGWSTFSSPRTFKNQGDCVSFMAKAKTINYELNSNNPDGVDIATKNNTWYAVTVSGTWTNRAGEVVDAECTNRFNNTWANQVVGGYSPNLLDVQVNEQFVSWGDCNTDDHSYTMWIQGDGSPINLRVFDGDTNTNQQILGWFGDNVGILNVEVRAH